MASSGHIILQSTDIIYLPRISQHAPKSYRSYWLSLIDNVWTNFAVAGDNILATHTSQLPKASQPPKSTNFNLL